MQIRWGCSLHHPKANPPAPASLGYLWNHGKAAASRTATGSQADEVIT